MRVWLWIAAAELRRRPLRVGGRHLATFAGALALSIFVGALPAYRASFVSALEHASFDLSVACACSERDVEAIRGIPGVHAVAAGLGLDGAPVSSASTTVPSWLFALADVASADLQPLSPAHVISGRFDLGDARTPKVVVDYELARALTLEVGDTASIDLAGTILRVEVAAITGPAARLRGPSALVSYEVVAPLIPPDSPLNATPYTELFIMGESDGVALEALFPDGGVVVYTRRELIALMETQMEVSPPVIETTSVLATVGLVGFTILLAGGAVGRRQMLAELVKGMGSGTGVIMSGFLLTEAVPTAIAAGLGTAVALTVVVTGYFGALGVYVPMSATMAAVGALGAWLIACFAVALLIRPGIGLR